MANLNIHHYADYNLTVARHPSETTSRMVYRLLAYALHCHKGLEFTKGLASDAEPDLWKINYDGSIDHWIELGHLDERRIRQACSKAKLVSIFTYQGAQSIAWFNSIEKSSQRFDHLNITHLISLDDKDIETMVERGMDFSVTIEENDIWFANEAVRFHFQFINVLKSN